jgi:hypothetical protein
MPQKINLNVPPYNDDFDSSKGYYKVLFRPGYSIQARELTSLQSVLQNQIENIGRNKFKQGQQVIPGEVAFNNKLDYVKLSAVSEVAVNINGNIVFQKYDISNLIGATLQGLTSGVTASVISYAYGTDIESDVIFVKYTNSGNNNSESTFRQGETLEALNITDTPTLVVGTDGSVLPTTINIQDYDTGVISTIDSPAMGYASAVKVEQGVYFVNGYFVNNSEQLIVVDKYYNKPSVKVGFKITEEIVTPEQDVSLYDNAKGFSNYSAPGAHRLKINLSLVAKEYDGLTDEDYVQLVSIKNGIIQQLVKPTDYNLIEETLARRTYDESGDYVVDNFALDLREYYQKDNNKGLYPLNVETELVNNKSVEEASSLMVAGIGSGKAYIKGYEIINKDVKYLEVSKARDTLIKDDTRLKATGLSYFNLRNVYGSIPVNADGQELTAYPTIQLNSVFNDGSIGYNNTETTTGSGAAANVTISGGVVTNVTISNQGSGYTTAPSVAFASPGSGGVQAYGIANISADGKVTGVTLTNPGSGYTAAPTISFTDTTKQTVARRSKKFTLDTGVVTLYLPNPGNYASRTFPTSNTFGSSFTTLWYVVNKGTSPATTTVRSLDLLSYSIVKRPFDISVSATTIDFLELTVAGNKEDIYKLLREYDDTDPSTRRKKLFVSESDAQNYYFQTGVSTIFPYSEIYDYNEVITPIIGVCKPKDFNLVEKGAGFNPDLDIVLSKGRGTTTGGIGEIKVTSGGSGYTGAPTVVISGGGGSGATATANISGNAVTSITITNPGTGYTSGPEITFIGGNGSGAKAEAVFTSSYNAIFKMAYFNPTFFTKIIVDQELNNLIFIPGKYVVGSTSGAYGVIEGSSTTKYTSGNTLFVRVLSGEFISGETITDEDGNSRRIAREGTISHFVVMDRGAGYSSTTTKIKIDGVEYDTSSIEIGTYLTGIYKIIIKDRNLVSQTYATTPAVSFNTGSTNPTQNSVVAAVLYRNTVTNYSPQNVKSVQSTFGAGDAYTFTADVESFLSSYITNQTLTDFTFSGKKGLKYLECNGFAGDPSTSLVQGDAIQFTDDANNINRTIVQRVEKAQGLIKSKIYIDNVLRENVSNASIVRVRPNIGNASTGSLVVPTGCKYLENVALNSEDSKITYYFRRDFVTTASTSGGNVTFAAQLPYGTQRFASFTESNFIMTVLDKKSSTTLESGDIIYLKESQVSISNTTDTTNGTTAGSVSITLPSSFFGTSTNFPILKLTATLQVSKARPRLKTAYRNQRILIVSPGDRVVPIRGRNYDTNSNDILSYSDVFKIRYIYEGTSQTPPVVSASGELVTGTDVTERFSFDDGQRDTFYDVSRLILKPGYTAPTGQLIISFDYFEHSQGDFCTVDSYLHESGVELNEIPVFNSNVYGKISLRDVFDFRPKVDSTAIVSGYQDTAILSVKDFNNFTGSGGITSSTPATETGLEYTISFSSRQYLDRIDGVFVNKKGEFFVKEGNSSLNPTKPADVDDSLALYYMYVPAYTNTANDVRIIPVDNKRYTMRDIGKLEKRIERLEQYTLLSVLEQQALNMQVKDDVGADKFKTGFIVDNFENHGVGNLTSIDYKCAIDTQQSTLRPRSIESSYSLKEVNTRDEQRTLANYKNSNGVITLPYSDVTAIQNVFATKTLNPNPFVVDQYVGDASITPNIDQWYDQKETPLILDNDSKVFSVFYAKNDAREGFASIFDNFIVNWIGTNRVFYNVTSLSDTSSLSSTSTTSNATTASSSNISPQNNSLAQGVSTRSVGSNIVSSSIQTFCRSVPVYFTIKRMKPLSKFYVFMDGQSIDRWVVPDYKYTRIGGNSLSTFGNILTTDANGNASGMLLIPSGLPPQSGTSWTGDVNTISYDSEKGSPLSFITGIKTIKFTSDSTGSTSSDVDSFTEVKYYATGTLPSQPATIISTTPAILKSQEGIQFVESAKAQTTPNPLSQSFMIEGYDGGVFLTGIDLFFNKKSSTIPVKVYITNIESGKPGKYIVPGSECVLNPDTNLKIYTNGTLYLTEGESVTGSSSGAAGPIKAIYDRNNTKLIPSVTGVYTLTNDQVYTLVLSNHNGKTFIQNEVLSIPSLNTYNAANATSLKVTIAKNSGRIVGLKINNTGSGYDTATLQIVSPQLLGGTTASATCSVSGGNIFDTQLVVGGSGYTEPPAVIIKSTGLSASNADIEALLEIDTPAVKMGVAVDPGTTSVTNSTTPSHFTFEYPVYLQNNTEYAFAVETDSTDYLLWASKLGELEISTNSTVTSQPLLGSVYKSQNVDTWTEDLFEDIKFKLYRAEFDKSKQGIIELTNEQLGYELLDENPFETDSLSDTTATSLLFRNNNKIIKVNHRNNGFEDTGKSYVNFKKVVDVGGITSDVLTTRLFKVINSGNEFYNINPELRAASNAVGGGSSVLATYNRKYEKLYAQVSYLNFSNTKINAEVKTTNIIPVDSSVTNYSNYSQTTLNDGFEKTFLNEIHYFNNQKVLASRINELKNSSSVENRSLTYKLYLNSDVSTLSPVIDLRAASVKLVNNQVEKPSGKEYRFGRRDQILQFYPIYKVVVTGTDISSINVGDAGNQKIVTGNTSKAQGILVKLDTTTNELYIKLTTDILFAPSERLVFTSQPTLSNIFTSSDGLTEIKFAFPYNSGVVALDKTDLTKSYTNVISGKVISWDAEKKQLKISNNKNPINDNYTAAATTGSSYARIPFSNTSTSQATDIFRVGDILGYDNQSSDTQSFLEIKSISYSDGILYVSENLKNSSTIAKYVTKEISLANSSTGLDVKLTANLFEENDIQVLYKVKPASSQFNFDDLGWEYFNGDGSPDIRVVPSSDNSIAGYIENKNSYKEYKYSISNLNEFSSFAIKIVMRSSQPVFVPKIQDVRVVATF